MHDYQNYYRKIFAGTEESLSKIVTKIPDRSVVLDVGCGPGVLGTYLSEEKECIVDGVDFDADSIEMCRPVYRYTAVRNLESDLLSDVFKAGEYDYIVVADIVEHLTNPDNLLTEIKSLVKPDGVIIFSIPNVTHLAVGFELLLGQFGYRSNGILDSTHLRFYSKQSFLDKLEEFGLCAFEMDTVQKDIGETEFSDVISKYFPEHWLNELIANREDALTYQWLVSTKVNSSLFREGVKCITLDEHKPPLVFTAELYWADKYNSDFTDSNKIIGHDVSEDSELSVIDFYFSECGNFNEIKKIRIDPISDQKNFLIVNAEIVSPGKKVLWKWNEKNIEDEIYGARLVGRFSTRECLFQSMCDDPQWHPAIDQQVFSDLTGGCVFRLSFKCDDPLYRFYNENMVVKKISSIDAARDEELYFLRQQNNELQASSNELQNHIDSLKATRSWRITRPLRALTQTRRQFVGLFNGYRHYRKSYPGLTGLVQLSYKCANLIRVSGAKGLLNRIETYGPGVSALEQLHMEPDVILEDVRDENIELPEDIAVHVHVYYEDMVPEIRGYLENIPLGFHCYVTTDSFEKARVVEESFQGLKNMISMDTQVVENRGRDIAPMIVAMGAKLSSHEIVLHLHTKRSPHNVSLRGWRRYLLESLLGNSSRVASILQQFSRDPSLGLFFPMVFYPVRPYMSLGGNFQNMIRLLVRAGKDKKAFYDIRTDDFPAGSMFWFRGEVIRPFIQMQLQMQDFEPEEGQNDGALAHAIERLFVYFVEDCGFRSRVYSTCQFNADNGLSGFGWLQKYITDGTIDHPVIIFDHNRGGGANNYSRMMIDANINSDAAVLKCVSEDGYWYIDWMSADDDMRFLATDQDLLFDALAEAGSVKIVVNSLYGFPQIRQVIQKILALAKTTKAPLEYIAHDFYCLCPSPHLLDYNNEFCEVPEDHAICRKCLSKNSGWHIMESWADNIDEWRRPFDLLLEYASVVRFFDPSTVELYRKSFPVNSQKIDLTPHDDGYFECKQELDLSGEMHIGILGTLTVVKGGDVVNSLYRYLKKQSLTIPITVVGSSFIPMASGIAVLGSYEVNQLPDILHDNHINVILMPTIVPETFSYTLSEAMKMKLPVVAFDIGAQGNRVKRYEFGKVVPLGAKPAEILLAIKTVLNEARKSRK